MLSHWQALSLAGENTLCAIKAATSDMIFMSMCYRVSCLVLHIDHMHKLSSSWYMCKGDWLCPSCVGGERQRRRKGQSATAREHLLAGGKKLALVQIQALWQEPDGSQCFAGRWYEIPENTHTGRQVNTCMCALGAGRNPLLQQIRDLLSYVAYYTKTVLARI